MILFVKLSIEYLTLYVSASMVAYVTMSQY